MSCLTGGGGQLARAKVLHVTARTITDHLAAVKRGIARRCLRLMNVVITIPHDASVVSVAHDVRAAVERDRNVGDGSGRGPRRRIGRRR